MGTSFEAEKLASKYDDFKMPDISVFLDGKEIKTGNDICLANAEICISCRTEPNIAVLSFTVDRINGAPAMEKGLSLGNKAEIKLGYKNGLTAVFLGYLHEIEVTSHDEEYAEYELTCLDVKGRMMAGYIYETSGQKKEEQLLQEIIKKAPYGDLIGSKKLDSIDSSMNKICLVNGMSHYQWVSELAKRLDYEFYMAGETLYFKKSREDSTPLTELTRDYGVLEIQTRVTLAEQVGELEVTGYNRKEEILSVKVKRKNAGGPFESGIPSFLRGSDRTKLDPYIDDKSQSAYVARTMMQRIERKSSAVNVLTIGIPELVPGRFVKITDDCMSSLTGKAYIEEVTHFYGENGYLTMLKGYR